MIETYKIIEGHDKVRTRGTFLELDENQNRTRGHNKKLTKPRHRTMKRTKFFPARVVDLWNSLPEHVVNSRSVNEFKRRYDRHISQRSTEQPELYINVSYNERRLPYEQPLPSLLSYLFGKHLFSKHQCPKIAFWLGVQMIIFFLKDEKKNDGAAA